MSLLSAGLSVTAGPSAGPRLTLAEPEWQILAPATTLGQGQLLSGSNYVLVPAPMWRPTSTSFASVDWSWMPQLIDRLRELLRLPRDWDSYGAEPVTADAALTAAVIANASVQAGASLPNIVPTVAGGIQLEWIKGAQVLEVEIASPMDVAVLYQENQVSIWEGSLLADPARFEELLGRIALAH